MAATWIASAGILIIGLGYGPETGIKVKHYGGQANASFIFCTTAAILAYTSTAYRDSF